MAPRKKTPEKNRVKLLVGIINKEDEGRLTDVINECATAVHFSGMGHGTARLAYMNYFGLGEVDKRVTMSLIPASAEHNILEAVGHGLKLYLVGRGIAFTVPLSGISNIINDALLSGVEKPDKWLIPSIQTLLLRQVDLREQPVLPFYIPRASATTVPSRLSVPRSAVRLTPYSSLLPLNTRPELWRPYVMRQALRPREARLSSRSP